WRGLRLGGGLADRGAYRNPIERECGKRPHQSRSDGCAGPERGYRYPHLMGTFEIIVGAIVLAVLAFQVLLTVRGHRSKRYEPRQKSWQTPLIWLLPIVGAGLVFSILQEDERAQRPPSELKS